MTILMAQKLSRHDRLLGLLLGGAVGDALGAPVEFINREEILSRFGPDGITDFAPAYGRLGAITDDTQLTLFTLEGLIRAKVRAISKGMSNTAGVIDHAYRRWYATQMDAPLETFRVDGWLITVPELWSQRAPGSTCLRALALKKEFGDPASNDSKGAGAIMRVGPIGLVGVHRPYELACEAAAMTHGHVTGIVASGWFAAWIEQIADGLHIKLAARRAWDQCRGVAPELDVALMKAFALAGKGLADQVPPMLGEGWIAEEAAAIALWCVLTASTPIEALRLAVNIDGDSDTTGSLVGQVIGATLGPDWIPAEMLQQLELAEVMKTLAADADWIFWQGSVDGSEAFEQFWERYPGW